jgi:uncharacterized protein YhjY with autotransporter beta-barrel domain
MWDLSPSILNCHTKQVKHLSSARTLLMASDSQKFAATNVRFKQDGARVATCGTKRDSAPVSWCVLHLPIKLAVYRNMQQQYVLATCIHCTQGRHRNNLNSRNSKYLACLSKSFGSLYSISKSTVLSANT